MKNKTKFMVMVLAIMILCAAAFTVLYLCRPHTDVKPIESRTESTESGETETSTAPTLPFIPPIISNETDTETVPLVINVVEMTRDPNPHIISTDIIYEEDNE